MSKTATRKPKQFSKRTDDYTAWLITFGHRWVTIDEITQWGMGKVAMRVSAYRDNTIKEGKFYTRLLTPEELECQQ